MTGVSPDLRRFRDELEENRRAGAELLDGLSRAQLAWRPAAGAWSAGEVAAHLRITNQLYVPAIERSIARARVRGLAGSEPYRPGLIGGLLVRSMRSPRRVPAPRALRPEPGTAATGDWDAEREGYRATLDRLEALLGEAEGVSLNRARVVSPVSRLIRLRLGDAFALWLTHDRRHLAQIGRVRGAPGFPRI